MDSTRVTEHPTSHERPQGGAGPTDPRGALLRTQEPLRTGPAAALPAQARVGDAPAEPGTATSCAKSGQAPSEHAQPAVSEHSQPAATEPDPPHRPRPAPETIPAQPGGEPERSGGTIGALERRSGQGVPPGAPMPMRRDGDRLRFVGAATRRIARGIDLDEIVMGLCRATVPTFSDAILVYLREPLPVGDERPTGPMVLRLRRTDRIPEERDTEGGFMPSA
ncbi:MAG TPA: serine/threonine protein phosphatase, partial [Streptomyces sp.]|nr:serine/threonine protein phosphatase [Streptomyces sp.]